ncbi:translation initiation factor IF-2 (macronuclear) [Tetrahymena thermophila SB210]|uniref:Translation initiation factor IF-2, mitochondrial n=1 Tax=Tetrahymena thermophila (strain SB210) TaxID=312017 RepID=Q239N3_TETTS|nr:translation initiation factor IF-2 [Tetrahymena thermophila SB210]EAR93237.2 translation initiation factor IF-2 [Tetrahymena thermophila SB210]|eukprot:XP_001013482.2 translation initiation factor IF-2 [Tetrahymena thermophila SB210]
MLGKIFKQKLQFIKSSLKIHQNSRLSLIQNIQFQSRSPFCSLEQRPQILKNSIKLGNDASKGQQIQKNLQEEFNQIELISNPQHQNRVKKIIQTYVVNTDFVNIEQLAEFIAFDGQKLLQKLTSMGINPEKISLKEANLISLEYDVKIQHKNEKGNIKQRSPVVTIMGHVDHGKTTLLDYLRNSQIAKGEFGGITQKIGAFHVLTPEGQRITFIDTPGHEAFSNMRVRGANSTDMIILVVSAIEGIQPQTLEVIKLAHQNQVHILVAINKIDVPGARPDLVEKQLKEQGKLDLEPFGGNIPVVHISALNGTNMDLLLELILFESELMELKEDYDSLAEGVVIESRRDVDNDEKSCTIIVQKGTLKVGDHIIIGNNYCKVRSIKDDKKNMLKQAFPSYAVEITGIKELPQSGDVVFALESENKAKVISQRRIKNEEELNSQEEQFIQGSGSKLKFENVREKRKFFSGNREITEAKYNEVEARILDKIKQLEEIDFKSETEMNDIQQKIQKLKQDLQQNKQYMANLVGDVKVGNSINLIIKANDFGTKETLVSQIIKAKLAYEDIQLNIISATVGQVTEADIRDAELFNAKILGMDIQLSKDVEQLVKQKKIVVKSHKIIYTLIDDIKLLMEQGPEEAEEEEKEVERGQAVIQSVIEIKASKSQTQFVAGCKVLSGKINKKHLYRIERDGEIIEKDLEIANLRHFKKEVEEIKEGSECGIIFFRFNSFEEGDTVVAYEKE